MALHGVDRAEIAKIDGFPIPIFKHMTDLDRLAIAGSSLFKIATHTIGSPQSTEMPGLACLIIEQLADLIGCRVDADRLIRIAALNVQLAQIAKRDTLLSVSRVINRLTNHLTS